MEQGKYLATPRSPQSNSAQNTAVANSMIMSGFDKAKNTYIGVQDRIYKEMLANNESASQAQQIAASAIGRKGYQNMVVDFNDAAMAEINEIQKRLHNKPFDTQAKADLNAAKMSYQSTLKNISYMNQMYDVYDKRVSEGDYNQVLDGGKLRQWQGFLSSVDKGGFKVAANGTVTAPNGQTGTFSEVLGAGLPELGQNIDHTAVMAKRLQDLRLKDPDFKKVISENGFLIESNTYSPEQMAKINNAISGVVFTEAGELTQIGEMYEFMRQAGDHYENGGNQAKKLTDKQFVNWISSQMGGEKVGKAPEKSETGSLKVAEQKQQNFDITMRGLRESDPKFVGGLRGAQSSAPITMTIKTPNGKVDKTFSDGVVVEKVRILDNTGEFPIYEVKILSKTKGSEEKTSKVFDMNNKKDDGEFRTLVSTLDQFSGVDPLITPTSVQQAKGEGLTEKGDTVTIDRIVKAMGEPAGKSESEREEYAEKINEELGVFDLSAKRTSWRDGGWNGIIITDKDGTEHKINNVNTDKGKITLRKKLTELTGGNVNDTTPQPNVDETVESDGDTATILEGINSNAKTKATIKAGNPNVAVLDGVDYDLTSDEDVVRLEKVSSIPVHMKSDTVQGIPISELVLKYDVADLPTIYERIEDAKKKVKTDNIEPSIVEPTVKEVKVDATAIDTNKLSTLDINSGTFNKFKKYEGLTYSQEDRYAKDKADCSSIVCRVYDIPNTKEAGVSANDIYRGSYTKNGRAANPDTILSESKDGDIVFFDTGAKKGIDHTGIVVVDKTTGKKYIAEATRSKSKKRDGTYIIDLDKRLSEFNDTTKMYIAEPSKKIKNG